MARELIATLVTDANGEASYTYTGTGAGETTFIAESGDLESEPLVINDISEELTLTSDKNILSYVDNDTAILTATYDGTTLEGKSVVFKLGNRVLDTVQTDSEGVAEYEYSSQGIGDIVFTAECGELQETYEIEDCYFYDTLTTDKQLFSIATGSGTLTYSNDGLTFRDSTSSETKVLFDKQLPTSDYEVSYDIVAYGNTNNKPQVCFEDFFLGINNNGYYGRRVSVSGNIWKETGSPTPPHTIKHKITGTSSKTVETYQNSTLLGTATSINQTRVMQIFAYENDRSITFTNLKIKPLPFNGSLSVSASKDILSYADNDSCTLTATLTGDNVDNRPVVFKNGNTVLDIVNTNSNGVATYTYNSEGTGNVTFTVECMNLQETYEVEDCVKYIETGSKTFSSSSMDWQILSDLDGIGDFELTYEISATGNKGFAIAMASNNTETSSSTNKVRGQVDGAGFYGTYSDINGSQNYTLYDSQYSANTYFTVTLQCISGHITITHNGKTHTDNRTFNLRYLMIGNWNSAKTINYRNLKVKSLPFNGSMSISASKDILSYADGDECVLTATLTGDDVANKSVVFKNGSTVLDTVNTDSNGVATYTYNSQGVGDVTFTVECMNLQETYEVEDYTCYDTTEYNTQQSKDISLPSDFEINIDLMSTSSSNSYPQVYIGTELNTNHISFGQMSQQKQGMEFKKNNSRLTLLLTNGSQSANNWYNVTLKKQGDDYTFLWGNETLSYTDSSISADKLFLIYLPNGKSRNLKIKPLPEQEEDTPLPTILYSNDGTKTDLQLPDGGTCTTNGEYLILDSFYKKRAMIPVTLEGDWEFSFDIKSRIYSAFNLVVGNVEIADGNSRDAGTVIKLVCEQGTVKEYANDTLISSNTISSSNYSIGVKPIVNSFFLNNLLVKRLGE